MKKAGRPYGPQDGRAMDNRSHESESVSMRGESPQAPSRIEHSAPNNLQGPEDQIQRTRLVKTNASVKKPKWSAKSRWRVMMGGRR